MTAWYQMTPLDVVLFRDARPFAAADAHSARLIGQVPPQMSVFGAFRHALLHHHGITYREFGQTGEKPEALGTGPATPGTLALGPVLRVKQEGNQRGVLYPTPADLIQYERRESRQRGLCYQVPGRAERDQTNLPDGVALLSPRLPDASGRSGEDTEIGYELDGRLLHSACLKEYLLGRPPVLEPESDLFGSEFHLGIARNVRTQTVREGQLYNAEFLRARSFQMGQGTRESGCYGVEVLAGGEELPERFLLGLGGERRPVEFRREGGTVLLPAEIEATVREELQGRSAPRTEGGSSVQFRLYLTSQAPPEPGEQSGWAVRLPKLEGVEIQCMAAAVPRPVWTSGWDVASQQPRAARPMIPAGAVYFVSARWDGDREGLVERLFATFWNRPALCPAVDGRPNVDALCGFGYTLMGVMPDAN